LSQRVDGSAVGWAIEEGHLWKCGDGVEEKEEGKDEIGLL